MREHWFNAYTTLWAITEPRHEITITITSLSGVLNILEFEASRPATSLFPKALILAGTSSSFAELRGNETHTSTHEQRVQLDCIEAVMHMQISGIGHCPRKKYPNVLKNPIAWVAWSHGDLIIRQWRTVTVKNTT